MYFTSIPLILIILALLGCSIICFLTQKNWATVLLLISTSFFITIIGLIISAFFGYDPQTSARTEVFIQVSLSIATITFTIGLIGYMYSSRVIHLQSEKLKRDNDTLSKQLNQLSK